MRQVNIHEAKTHLSRLVEEAAAGNSFIIAKSGRPIAKVTPLDESQGEPRIRHRIGFLKGRIAVPDDFDTMGAEDIRSMFLGEM